MRLSSFSALACLIAHPLLAASPTRAQDMEVASAPCQEAGSMVDTNICLSDAYRQADAQLNSTYRRIMSVLNEQEKVALRNAQRAWITYRDLACEAQSQPYRGKSGESIARLECLEAVTRAQTGFMKNGFWWKVEKFSD